MYRPENRRLLAHWLLDRAEEISEFGIDRACLDTSVRDHVSTSVMRLVEAACIIAADVDAIEGVIAPSEMYAYAAWNAAGYLAEWNLRFLSPYLREHLPPVDTWPNNWQPWEWRRGRGKA